MTGVALTVGISGAGLAGLCLGQALSRMGINIQIFERDLSFTARRQGYRLTINEYGAWALQSCLPSRLYKAVKATASPPQQVGYFRFTDHNLREIFKLTFRRDPTKSDPQMLGQVDRATLRAIMASGLESRIHFGKTTSRLESRPKKSILHFTDGTLARASLIIGADGIQSPLRKQLLPDSSVVDLGSRGIYGKTSFSRVGRSPLSKSMANSGVMALGTVPGQAFFCTSMIFSRSPEEVSSDLHLDLNPLVSGDYVMWAILLPKTQLPENFALLDSRSLHSVARDAVRHFHPILQALVESADLDYTVRVALSAATKPNNWPALPATLIGDAVHVMPPIGGNGGNTALRDAATLAEELRAVVTGQVSLEEAVSNYQAKMLSYAFVEVERSVSMLRRVNMTNSLARFLLLQIIPWLRSRFGPALRLE